MEKEIYYNVWTSIEQVTITNGEEVYEDLKIQEKVGQAKTYIEAREVQLQLSKDFESTYSGEKNIN